MAAIIAQTRFAVELNVALAGFVYVGASLMWTEFIL